MTDLLFAIGLSVLFAAAYLLLSDDQTGEPNRGDTR